MSDCHQLFQLQAPTQNKQNIKKTQSLIVQDINTFLSYQLEMQKVWIKHTKM